MGYDRRSDEELWITSDHLEFLNLHLNLGTRAFRLLGNGRNRTHDLALRSIMTQPTSYRAGSSKEPQPVHFRSSPTCTRGAVCARHRRRRADYATLRERTCPPSAPTTPSGRRERDAARRPSAPSQRATQSVLFRSHRRGALGSLNLLATLGGRQRRSGKQGKKKKKRREGGEEPRAPALSEIDSASLPRNIT